MRTPKGPKAHRCDGFCPLRQETGKVSGSIDVNQPAASALEPPERLAQMALAGGKVGQIALRNGCGECCPSLFKSRPGLQEGLLRARDVIEREERLSEVVLKVAENARLSRQWFACAHQAGDCLIRLVEVLVDHAQVDICTCSHGVQPQFVERLTGRQACGRCVIESPHLRQGVHRGQPRGTRLLVECRCIGKIHSLPRGCKRCLVGTAPGQRPTQGSPRPNAVYWRTADVRSTHNDPATSNCRRDILHRQRADGLDHAVEVFRRKTTNDVHVVRDIGQRACTLDMSIRGGHSRSSGSRCRC